MKVKINDKFEIESDSNQWKLNQYVDGINPKTKEPTVTKKTTYYGRLDQLLASALDKELKDCDTTVGLLSAIKEFKTDCLKAINKGKKI
ncbi:hypothetical protein [Pseudoalteromonas marina]|uniref:hypothetical protein n=1 Tax=Pseudoalteromonas marina TaxID=267375 RepID=UPI003C691266